MVDRRSRATRILQIEIPILLVVAFALGPYLWMVLTSIKPDEDITQWPLRYWPSRITFARPKSISHGF